MELLPLLLVGAIVGFVTGVVVGGPGTGYLASAVVGIAGTLLGVGVNSVLGIPGAGDIWTILILGILGSSVLRLAMVAASSLRVAGLRRG